MSLLNKEPVKRAEKALKQFNETLSVTELENTARTAIDAATSLNCEVGAIVKSLLFKNGDNYFLCLVSGDKRCSLNKLKKFFNSKDLSMASPNDVKEQTGYTIGGVSPIGLTIFFLILVYSSLNRFTTVFAAAGHPNCIFKIEFNQLTKLTTGEIKEITE
jgi:Cys-tRNA(Pro) deacylase